MTPSTFDMISVGWLVENSILKLQIGGTPDANAIIQTDDARFDDIILRYLEASDHTLSMVVHLQPTQSSPSVSRLRALKHPRHPRMGHIMLVNHNPTPLARFFISIVSSVSGIRLKSARSIDEAVAFLQAQYPTP